jgi:alpha-tubulin suppressor-like RCC1 family protein
MPLNEGQTVQYTVTTTNTADGTVLYWKTTGNTTNSDIVGGNTGTITITNNRATFNVTIFADTLTEGVETIDIAISTGSLNGPTVVSTANPININDTSLSPAPERLYSWGDNSVGQLGLNDRVYRSSPTQVGTGTNWSKVNTRNTSGQADPKHTIATKTDGTLWIWGENSSGQLGTNDRVNRSSPTQLGSGTWSQVEAGWNGMAAIKTNGTLWTWGSNNFGQLSTNDKVYRSSPTQVGTETDWSQISMGNDSGPFISAIKTTGTLWQWGSNGYGMLGQNNTTDRSSPVQVGTDANWSQITSGQRGSLAIKTNGTLWSWGRNYEGWAGYNNTSYKSSPTQVGALTNWSQVSMRGNAVMAIKTDGTLWSWGGNFGGVLGQNDTVFRSSPTQVGTDTDWSKISASSMVLATKTNGTLWTWGFGSRGDLGSNNVVARSSPVQVGANTNWSLVNAGGQMAFAITSG